MERSYRPPPLERKFQHVLYFLSWSKRGSVRELIEKSLCSFLLNEIDITMCEEANNNNNFDMKQSELLIEWLKKKEKTLYEER